jgi:hypothetical protein
MGAGTDFGGIFPEQVTWGVCDFCRWELFENVRKSVTAELQVYQYTSVDILSATGAHLPFNTLVMGMEQIDLRKDKLLCVEFYGFKL